MRIPRPLIATGIGAGALGATLALGITVATAATGAPSTGATSHSSAVTASMQSSPSPSPSQKGTAGTHKCLASTPGARHGIGPRAGHAGSGGPDHGMGGSYKGAPGRPPA